jgi:hypothetical protein
MLLLPGAYHRSPLPVSLQTANRRNQAMRMKGLLPVSFAVTTALLATGACGGLVELSQGNEQAADDSQDPNPPRAEGVADLTIVLVEKAPAAASASSAPLAVSTASSATALSLEPQPPSDSGSGSVDGSAGVTLPIPEDVAQKPPLSDAELKAMSESSANKVSSERARTLSLELSSEGGEARLLSLDLSKSNELSVKDFPTGTWTLAIRLLDAAGTVQLKGNGQIVVVAGQQNTAHLSL